MSSDNIPEPLYDTSIEVGIDSKDISSFSTESTVAAESTALYTYQSYKGAFPPLEYLEFFETTNDGSTKVILDSYMKEQEYRHAKELKQMDLDNKKEDNRHKEEVESMRWGFLLVVVFFCLFVHMVYIPVLKKGSLRL